jgi:hypothetical protein
MAEAYKYHGQKVWELYYVLKRYNCIGEISSSYLWEMAAIVSHSLLSSCRPNKYGNGTWINANHLLQNCILLPIRVYCIARQMAQQNCSVDTESWNWERHVREGKENVQYLSHSMDVWVVTPCSVALQVECFFEGYFTTFQHLHCIASRSSIRDE